MTLICFKNGSLAREKIRELYGVADWKQFGELLKQTQPGNDGGILLPWFEAEIVPRVNKPGIHRFDLDEKNAAANCRAIFEAQMLSMRLHSQWMNVSPEKIFATGGASNDAALLQPKPGSRIYIQDKNGCSHMFQSRRRAKVSCELLTRRGPC